MSRCFPFPPPGYEKKIRTDEAEPLVKDKYKEKKHKKDKEKKEGKEKKSKDRSKDKQKERKEKKDKHKDRKDKEKDKEKSKPLEEKKAEVLTNTGHREKLVTNAVQNNINGESKYVQDLARRIRYDEEATGSQSAQKIDYPNPKNLGITGRAFENGPVEEITHRVDEDKRINTPKNFAAAKSSKNATSRVYLGADQKRTEVMSKPMENRDKARQTESAEKSHRKQSVTKGDKPRDQEGEKKNEAKDKDRIKEKKEENIESINKTRQEKPKLIGGPRLEEREKDYLDIRNSKPPDLSRASFKNVITEGNLGKRKDHETNGFLYENGTTPHKLQRHSTSSPSVENGRTLGAPRTPPMPASKVQETTCKPQVKEVRINGFAVSGEKQKVCPPSPLAATMKVKVKENGEASIKPPHPDLKYLNQILNVPTRELLLEVDDDQEWLLGQSGVKLKKARTDTPDSGESLQVWNQAFRVESADIVALPYVIPF
ncbi:PREDICTED: myb-like protein X [Camelina sativa]|uniref:Myb-like protein X n=1 Tax=Camelina sativa TaxID=90675 RepID=A0ABM0UK26_CAMSA|nr:PREDICTED: myb-like protein X [Camelina sativa]